MKGEKMHTSHQLKDKVILVVDDEPDILVTIEEMLEGCIIHKAEDYKTASQYLMSYTYDIVILDIMGVNGFELLKNAVDRGFPSVMITAKVLTPQALKKAIRLGAVSFLPKDKLSELPFFLEEVVLGGGKAAWRKLFDRFGHLFDRHFGPDWQEREQIFKEFETEVEK